MPRGDSDRIVIQLRCTAQQKAAYEAAAAAEGLSVSEWLRALAEHALGPSKRSRQELRLQVELEAAAEAGEALARRARKAVG